METKNWTPACTAISALTRKFDFSLSFKREQDGGWYVDIPYPLSHANLQMVAGADRFFAALDHLQGDKRRVTVRFSSTPFEDYEH